MQRLVLGVVVGTVTLAAFAVPVASQAPAKPAASAAPAAVATRAVATTKQLMHAITIPASDVVFKAAGEPPTTDAAWAAVQLQALALAESGNLLMIGPRVQDRTTWMTFSRAMIDAAAGAAKAAEAKNADALSTASDQVYETCESCHARYLKK